MAAAVILGAFGAHALRPQISPERMAIYHTAVFYHAIHALGLFVLSWLSRHTATSWPAKASFLFIAGIILFSGSLYGLAVTQIKILGMITPFGGLCFILGWVFTAIPDYR